MRTILLAVIMVFVLAFLFTGMVYAESPALNVTGNYTGLMVLFFAVAVGLALAADTPPDYELGDINELPVKAASKIYEGSAVGDDAAGYARALVAGDPFRGFAESQVDNSIGTAGAGDKNVRVITKGRMKAAVSGLAITDVGADIYMSDDATFTKTVGSNTRVGTVYRYVSSGVGIVSFNTDETQTVGTSEIAAGAVTLVKLATGITPSHIVVFSGEHTTAGGAAGEDITVAGALATDIVLCALHTVGSSPQTILTALAATDKITITFSANPSTDHVVSYVVLRAAS